MGSSELRRASRYCLNEPADLIISLKASWILGNFEFISRWVILRRVIGDEFSPESTAIMPAKLRKDLRAYIRGRRRKVSFVLLFCFCFCFCIFIC